MFLFFERLKTRFYGSVCRDIRVVFRVVSTMVFFRNILGRSKSDPAYAVLDISAKTVILSTPIPCLHMCVSSALHHRRTRPSGAVCLRNASRARFSQSGPGAFREKLHALGTGRNRSFRTLRLRFRTGRGIFRVRIFKQYTCEQPMVTWPNAVSDFLFFGSEKNHAYEYACARVRRNS